MADNSVLPATGETIATDEIGGVKFQRVKPTYGVDGTAIDVSDSNPLPTHDDEVHYLLGSVLGVAAWL